MGQQGQINHHKKSQQRVCDQISKFGVNRLKSGASCTLSCTLIYTQIASVIANLLTYTVENCAHKGEKAKQNALLLIQSAPRRNLCFV